MDAFDSWGYFYCAFQFLRLVARIFFFSPPHLSSLESLSNPEVTKIYPRFHSFFENVNVHHMPVLPGIEAKDVNNTWILLLTSSVCNGQLDTKGVNMREVGRQMWKS